MSYGKTEIWFDSKVTERVQALLNSWGLQPIDCGLVDSFSRQGMWDKDQAKAFWGQVKELDPEAELTISTYPEIEAFDRWILPEDEPELAE